jgi:hypothetical protein
VTKKVAFERWVTRSLRRREQEDVRARRRFDRDRTVRAWREWLGLEVTRQALVPVAALLVLATTGGWLLGQQASRANLTTTDSVESLSLR